VARVGDDRPAAMLDGLARPAAERYNSGVSRLAVGDTLGGFRIESLAGRGGMGVVYRAVQLELDRLVAVKVISPELALDSTYRDRFRRESRLAALIEHRNVLPVYEAGEL
jgi:serine/threonine protein kinase